MQLMKRSELFNILAIALVVAVAGLALLRPKDQASDATLASVPPIPVPGTPPNIEPERVQVAELPVAVVESPIQSPASEVSVRVRDPDSSGSGEGPGPGSEQPAFYEPHAELAAGLVPEVLASAMTRGVIPNGQALLKSGETVRRQERSALGDSLEAAIRNFLVAQPEITGMKYLASCGAELCEVQLEQMEAPPPPSAAPVPSATFLVATRLETQPWFQSALVLVGRNHFAKDGHPYFAGYWKVR